MSTCPSDPTRCVGHRRYYGGSMDGHVAHMTSAHPRDYPRSIGTLLRQGQRSWYVRDEQASSGTEVVYRFVGLGRACPQEATP